MQSFFETLQSACVPVVPLSAAEEALAERWRASTEAAASCMCTAVTNQANGAAARC